MNIQSLKTEEKEFFLRTGGVTRGEAKRLLEKLTNASGKVHYEEDYIWINRAVARWETYLKAEYGVLDLTPISMPEQALRKRVSSKESFLALLRRPLTELFAHFVLTEPSSGRVATAFAEMVAHLSQGTDVANKEQARTIIELSDLAQRIRPSLRQLAGFAIKNADNPQHLRTHLCQFLEMERFLPRKMRQVFERSWNDLGVDPQSTILLYGYSELMKAVLEAMPSQWRKTITVLISTCSVAWQRADGPLGQKLAGELGFRTIMMPERKTRTFIQDRDIAATFMGCRAVGRLADGTIAATNLRGSAKVSSWAYGNNAKVCIMLPTRKIQSEAQYPQKRLPLGPHRPTGLGISSRWALKLGQTDIPPQDHIPQSCISFFATQDGLFDPQQFAHKYQSELRG